MPPLNDENLGDLEAETDTVDTHDEEDRTDGTLDDVVDTLDDGNDDDTDTDVTDGEDDDEEATDELADLDEDGETDPDAAAEGDEVIVKMDDGTELPVAELKKGFMLHKDYTHKTEALAADRRELDAARDGYTENAKSLQTAFDNLTTFVEGLVPPEPPLELAQTNPADYQYQKALRQNIIDELQGVYQGKAEVAETIQGATAQDLQRYKDRQDAELLKALPGLKDPKRRTAFDTAVKATAQEFGFSEDEIGNTVDSRILQLVHYARIGKTAETNRKNARRRVNEKPRKGGRQNPIAHKPSTNSRAIARLSKDDSLENAMAIEIAD